MKFVIKVFVESLICLTLLACVLLGFSALGNFSLNFPLVYTYDGAGTNAAIKLIVEHYLYVMPYHVGYLNGFSLQDFPSADYFSIFQILIIAKLLNTINPFLIANTYFLLSYASVALCSLWVFRFYKIRLPIAIAGAIIYTLLPYHFYRSTLHLFLSSYLTIPLWTMLCIEVYTQGKIILVNNKLVNYSIVSIIILICATSGVYYAFFGCLFIFISGGLSFYNNKKKGFLLSLLIILATIIILLIQILPTIINNHIAGSNIMAAVRSPMQTEIYGLRIAHLLLPSEYSRIEFLANISKAYDNVFFNEMNESIYSHLGIITSIGFIILILVIFIDKIAKNNQIIKLMGNLNLIAILFAGTGGFASVFSVFVMDEIRSVNRVSVFIAFFAILSLMLLVQRFIENKKLPNKSIYWLIGIVLIYVAAIDQVDPNAFDNRALKVQSINDGNFVRVIEKIMPKNSAIFELPFMDYPEPQILQNKLTTYELFVPYMYSHGLYWSYGATKGRSVASWQEHVVNQPLSQMLNSIIAAGYTGIFIDNAGYKNPSSDIIKPLSIILKTNPISSVDNHYSYFDLRNFIINQQISSHKTQCLKNNEKIDMQSYTVLGQGFEPQKTLINKKLYNIAHENTNFTVFNSKDSVLPITFDILVPREAKSQNITKLFLNTKLLNQYQYMSQNIVPIKLDLLPGYNHIKLVTNYKDSSQGVILLMAADIKKILPICN